MRCNCLILVFFIINSILLLQMGCQEQAKVPTEPEAAIAAPQEVTGSEKAEAKQETIKIGPKITFEDVVYDFGEIGPGTKQSGKFKFTNTGDSLLKITNVKGCCGAVTKLDKREYLPGESGLLKVEYQSRVQAGLIGQQLHVNSNDKTKPSIALTIKANIVPKVSYEPKRLQLLLEEENPSYPNITLTSLDGKLFSINGFQSTGNCITADYDPSVEATKFVLQPNVDMASLQKRLNGIIQINLTHPEGKSIIIPFNALPKFKISPPQIIAFNAEEGKSMTRKIWVLNNYGKHFEVESASSQNGIIKVLSQDKMKNGYQFLLEIMPPAAEGKTKFADVFNVNIKGGEKLTIICRGFYLRRK